MDFLEAFHKLVAKAPRPATYNFRDKNCHCSNFLIDSVNCHYCFNSGNLNNCAYCSTSNHCQNSLDLDNCEEAENCYECSDSSGIKNCNYLINCFSCTNCELSEDLFDCNYCFGCVGLFKKEYYIFNKPYINKKKFAEKMVEIKEFMSKEEILRTIEPIRQSRPRVNMQIINSKECYGDYIFDSEVVQNGYNVSDAYLSSYIYDSEKIYFSTDCNNCFDISNCYDCVECSQLYFGSHCFFVSASRYMTLCTHCFDCDDCIGCINLRKKKFHILNVPYSESEYRLQAKKIFAELESLGPLELSQHFSIGK